MKISNTGKTLMTALLVGILFALCLYLLLKGVQSTYEKEKKGMDQYVGKKVVVDNDTLIIVDYSIWNEEYTTNTGLVLDEGYVERYVITK